MKKKRETLVLLDTHAIIHRAYHALPELTNAKGEPVGAVYGLVSMLLKLIQELKPDHIIAAYDLPGPTLRHEVYKEYKAKRPKADDALVAQIVSSRRALEAFSIPIYEAPGFEADDIIGTIATAVKKNFNVIIASGDMDTLQLVHGDMVRVYTLRKGLQDTILYDEKAVLERYGFPPTSIPDYKGFAGDPSDNIIGVPGVGEKTATTVLKEFGTLEAVYKALKSKNWNDHAKKLGITERIANLLREHQEEAEFSKVLATIRTDAPISFVEPVKSFTESLNPEKLVAFLTDNGFRSLVSRARALVKIHGETVERPTLFALPTSVDQALLKECAVLAWLLNPELANPTPEDVLDVTGASTVDEAHRILEERVRVADLAHVFETIEKPLIPVIDAMNARGVKIDATHLKTLSKEYHKDLDALAAAIYRQAGTEFNINSPRQLGDVLFGKLNLSQGSRQKKTATGQLSTKESELKKLASAHPIIELILSYRELSKLLGTYIDAIPPLLDEKGRLHSTFSQTGAATGRLSSRDPGLQNIPIKTDLGRRIRSAFIAEKGNVLIGCDYSQIELRLAAILSGDEKLVEIFKNGEDVHSAVASQVFGVPESEVTKEMRRRAKVINFGILYGMGVNALRENLGTDRAEAAEFYDRYFKTYAGLADYLERTKASAMRLGYTTTLFGRKRFFPGIKSSLPFVRAQAERMAINAPLQGTQADIIKIAMRRIHDVFENTYASRPGIVLQIHDELVIETPRDIGAEIAVRVKEIMEGVLSKKDTNGVPITVTSEMGETWGSMTAI